MRNRPLIAALALCVLTAPANAQLADMAAQAKQDWTRIAFEVVLRLGMSGCSDETSNKFIRRHGYRMFEVYQNKGLKGVVRMVEAPKNLDYMKRYCAHGGTPAKTAGTAL